MKLLCRSHQWRSPVPSPPLPLGTHHGFTEQARARPQSPDFPSAALSDFLSLSLSRLPPCCHPVFNLQQALTAGFPHRCSPPCQRILLPFGAVWSLLSSLFSTAICLMIYSFSGFPSPVLVFHPFCLLPSLFTSVAMWHVFALHPINLSFNHCLPRHGNKSQPYPWESSRFPLHRSEVTAWRLFAPLSQRLNFSC